MIFLVNNDIDHLLKISWDYFGSNKFRKVIDNRGVPRIWEGGGQEFFFSDLGICMSRSDMLRMAKPCALLGGFGGMLPRENFLKRCNLVRFSVYFDQILALFFSKNAIFYIKINILDTHLLWGIFLVNKFLKTCYDWCVLGYTLKLKWLLS